MKNILLLGELDEVLGSLNYHLMSKFKTQMCTMDLNLVKAMIKIFKADMIVVCLNENSDSKEAMMDFLQERVSNVPVLLIGKEKECKAYTCYYESKQFDYLNRPLTLGVILRKCEEMLKIYEGDVEKTEEVKRERKYILAVDDSGILLRNIKTMLEKDYDVAVANSGMMALKQAKKRKPDVILLDYEMPEWDGKRTLEEIRNDEELKDIPVVFVTAVADKEHIAAVLNLHPSGYVLKPIEREKLYDTIENALIRM